MPHTPPALQALLAAYERNGNAIYEASFATIRREADLGRFPADLAQVAVRMIHACGQVDLTEDIAWTGDVVSAARSALAGGASILCDAHMVAEGITPRRLPADNDVICTLRDPQTRELASKQATTRSAAAVDLWEPWLDGSVVAIGNAPTTAFHLLQAIADGAAKPAALVCCPVGFIGAAESKEAALIAGQEWDIPVLVVRGRRGGSAITSAAVNALATPLEILR